MLVGIETIKTGGFRATYGGYYDLGINDDTENPFIYSCKVFARPDYCRLHQAKCSQARLRALSG